MNGQSFYSQEKRMAYLMGLPKRGEMSTTYKLDETVTGDLGEQTVSRKLYVDKQLIAVEVFPLNCREAGLLANIVDQLDVICGRALFNKCGSSRNNTGDNRCDVSQSLCNIFRMRLRLQFCKFKLCLCKFLNKYFGLECESASVKKVNSISCKR